MTTLNVIRELKKNKTNDILPSIDLKNTNNVSHSIQVNVDNFTQNTQKYTNKNNKLNKTIKINTPRNIKNMRKLKKAETNNFNNTNKINKIKNIENQDLVKNNEIIEEDFFQDNDTDNIDDATFSSENKFNTLQVFDLNKIQEFVKTINENNINDEEDLELFYDNIDMNLSKNLDTIYE